MNEHTPGPWCVVPSRKEKHKEARFIGVRDRVSGEMVFVGKAYGHDGEPVEANARLIAAAPDLKMAGEELRAALNHVVDPKWQDADNLKLALAAWDAAIAKAEGGTE